MGLFDGKSREQKRLEVEQRQKELELERQISDALKKIYVFPGSKTEFEDFIGYRTAWVDLGGEVKGLLFIRNMENPFGGYPSDLQKRIVDSGVVALVDSNFSQGSCCRFGYNSDYYFGMPVKKAS